MIAQLATLPVTNDAVDRRAAVIADVKQMHDDFIALQQEIGQLRADLNRERDRVAMMIEERDRYRSEAMLFRNLLIELATQQTNIGLLTVKAQEIMRTVNDLDKPATPAPDPVTYEWQKPVEDAA